MCVWIVVPVIVPVLVGGIGVIQDTLSHRWPPRHLHRGRTSAKPLDGGLSQSQRQDMMTLQLQPHLKPPSSDL